MFSLMRKYLKDYKWYAIFSPIFMILEVGTDIFVPYLMTRIVDVGIKNGDADYVIKYGIIMALVALFGMACGIISSFLGAKGGFGIGYNVRIALYKKIQELSFNQLDNISISSLITRVTADCATISRVSMMSLRMAIRSPVLLIAAMIAAFSIDVKLSLIFVLFIPVLAIGVGLIFSKVRKYFLELQERVDDLNSIVNEDLVSIRVIKSFVREDFEKDRFSKYNENLRTTALKAMDLLINMVPLMFIVIYAAIISVLWFGGKYVTTGRLGPGAITALITYCTQIYSALIMTSQYLMSLARANTSSKRVKEVLQAEPDLTSPEDGGVYEVKDGRVNFVDVDFRYPGNQDDTLSNINLDIESGQTIGVIGSTGSAKTTLVQLIPRLYDSTRGEVKVGGLDVRKYNLTALRDQVGYVLQDNTLFSGTIRSNMHWGDPEASDEKIIKALKNAQAWEFVKDLPGQLDAKVEQGGDNFSGGQQQRLTIARTLLKDPKILILDDSTSAVDMATDRKLRASFRKNLGDITTIIVAQRIDSIKDSDEIVVMKTGGIDQIGTHDELVKTNDVYRELYETQVKGGLAE